MNIDHKNDCGASVAQREKAIPRETIRLADTLTGLQKDIALLREHLAGVLATVPTKGRGENLASTAQCAYGDRLVELRGMAQECREMVSDIQQRLEI